MALESLRTHVRLSTSGMVLALTLMATSAMAPAQEAPPATARVQAEGSAEELRRLLDAHQLTELRSTRNGSYGASLLFQADKLSYYVALFHDQAFWRVIQTDSSSDAENLYRNFVAQTEQLAQVDIDALRLQAGKTYTEHLVAINQQRLRSLEQDSERQRQQAQQVAIAQQRAQQQAVSLTGDLRASSSQLDRVKQRIQALEAQQSNPELLPSSLPETPAASPASAAPPPGDSSP